MSAFTEYWNLSGSLQALPPSFPAPGTGGYLTFELDRGGLNNIRMQLEYLALLAAITGRTLVLPPAEGWYLINWGPIAREGDAGGVSHHGEFFDLPALKRWIDVVTTAEFIERERDSLGIPKELCELASPVHGIEEMETRKALRAQWTRWRRESLRTIPWNPLFNVLCLPDIESVIAGTRRPDETFMDQRTPVAIDDSFRIAPAVHFPCDIDAGLRQLGQVSKSFRFADSRSDIALWRMLKYGVRYVPQVFERAGRIIEQLGAFRYSSLHLRRNDLQYEVSKVEPEITARSIDELLSPGEPLYVATDETDEAFFEILKAQRPLYRYVDVDDSGPAGNNGTAAKLTGCVEQLICAGGRRFVGTPHSSFSTYISRVRGYIQAPDLERHHHTAISGQATRKYGFMRDVVAGRSYMQEDPVLWEDTGLDGPLYSVVCTDTRDYAHWQCELLEHTWARVEQPGDLIRLVSRRDQEPLPGHIHMQVIPTAYSNLHPDTGDEYVPFNRLFSFREWLESNPEPGTVLILDPDCIFRDRLPLSVPPGSPIGQPWRGFVVNEHWRALVTPLSPADPESMQAVTWPALIHTEDLRALLPRWIELTARLRIDTGAWESDMMAMVIAAAELKLTFREQDLAAVMNWPEEGPPAPIVHYCQPVESKAGPRLWFKQGYQPWTPTGVDPADAELDYCGDLLAILNEFIAGRQPPDAGAPTSAELPEAGVPDRFRVRVSLGSNAAIELDCRPGDPVLADLFASLVENSENPGAGGGKVLSVPTADGNKAHFHSSQIVAIETIPARE